MNRRSIVPLVLVAAGAVLSAQASERDTLNTFTRRIRDYVEVHRRMEGPIPPLAQSKDMEEVERLMYAVRVRIRSNGVPAQGHLLTPDVSLVLRRRIAAVLTRADITELDEDFVEHMPENMPPLQVYEPLPDDTPFIQVPPVLFKQLPALPPELRYVIASRALVIWDHHANLIVDLDPALFDPASYVSTGGRPQATSPEPFARRPSTRRT